MRVKRSASGSSGRRAVLLPGIVVALAVTGCGSSDFPNEPRAAAPIEVTASIGPRAVKISPAGVGAGIANFTIANLSSNPASFRLNGPNAPNPTDQIEPGGVTSIAVELKTGDYGVSAPGSALRGTSLSVGPPRPSSQNKLLLP
jgi:hypothetical protein